MDVTSRGVTQEKDHEEGIDQQDIFDRMVLFLAALTPRLCSSVLGADAPPFRPVMGKGGPTRWLGRWLRVLAPPPARCPPWWHPPQRRLSAAPGSSGSGPAHRRGR